MDRINGFLIFLYCVLLFSAGIVFSFLFTKDGEVTFVSFLSVLASIATIGAAATAIYALNIWYPQFKHAERFKVLKLLKKELDLGNSAEAYMQCVLFECIEKNTNGAGAGVLRYVEATHEARVKWRSQSLRIERCWDDVESLFSPKDLRIFAVRPHEIDLLVSNYVENLIYVTADYSSIDPLQLMNENGEVCRLVRDRFAGVSSDAKSAITKLVR
jgi:hypothetical protein